MYVFFTTFGLLKDWYLRYNCIAIKTTRAKVLKMSETMQVRKESESPCNHSPTFIHLHGVSVILGVACRDRLPKIDDTRR